MSASNICVYYKPLRSTCKTYFCYFVYACVAVSNGSEREPSLLLAEFRYFRLRENNIKNTMNICIDAGMC